jgi:hypothetical protein
VLVAAPVIVLPNPTLSWTASQQMGEQRYDKNYQENEEQNLGDSGRGECNASESQKAGYQCDDQKHQGVVKHIFSFIYG